MYDCVVVKYMVVLSLELLRSEVGERQILAGSSVSQLSKVLYSILEVLIPRIPWPCLALGGGAPCTNAQTSPIQHVGPSMRKFAMNGQNAERTGGLSDPYGRQVRDTHSHTIHC